MMYRLLREFRRHTSIHVAALCACFAIVLSACAPFGACGLHECPDDAKVSAQVRSLLAQNPALSGLNQIRVQTIHGVVYLRGLVSTPYQIADAGGIAAVVPGVTDVQNLLTIDNSH